MKSRIVTACAIAWLGGAGALAQTKSVNHSGVYINLDQPQASAKKNPPADPNAPAKPAAPANPSAGKTDPNKPAAPADAKKDAKKKEDEIGKIDGMEIARGTGFMGLQVVNGTFKLSFFDAKKKPVAPDVTSAAFRWTVPYQKAPERTILSLGDKALVSDKTVKPPYSFKLFVTLFKGEGEENAENLTIDFSQ